MIIKTRINYTQQSKQNITAKGECNGEERAHALLFFKKAIVFTSKLCTNKKRRKKKKWSINLENNYDKGNSLTTIPEGLKTASNCHTEQQKQITTHCNPQFHNKSF